jgi:hypothetical protein
MVSAQVRWHRRTTTAARAAEAFARESRLRNGLVSGHCGAGDQGRAEARNHTSGEPADREAVRSFLPCRTLPHHPAAPSTTGAMADGCVDSDGPVSNQNGSATRSRTTFLLWGGEKARLLHVPEGSWERFQGWTVAGT